jgi:DNA-binding transcriptional ArsR family regulator
LGKYEWNAKNACIVFGCLVILPNSRQKENKMNKVQKAHLEARAKIIKAMAHPSRLFIIEELGRGERCVCDLTAMVGADVSTVSKHLTVLKQAGIVTDDKRGNQVFYRLRVPCILNFFGCVESVLESQGREHLALLEGAAK